MSSKIILLSTWQTDLQNNTACKVTRHPSIYTIAFSMLCWDRNYLLCPTKHFLSLDTFEFDRQLRPLLWFWRGLNNWTWVNIACDPAAKGEGEIAIFSPFVAWLEARVNTKHCSLLTSKYTIAFSMLCWDRNYLLCPTKHFLSLDTCEFDRQLRPLSNWRL